MAADTRTQAAYYCTPHIQRNPELNLPLLPSATWWEDEIFFGETFSDDQELGLARYFRYLTLS